MALIGFGLDSAIEGVARVIIISRFTGQRLASQIADATGAAHCAGLPTVLHAADHADLPHAALDVGRPVANAVAGSSPVAHPSKPCTGPFRCGARDTAPER
jgi:hypothetical protein